MLIKKAEFFMSAISFFPIKPLVRSLRTVCIETKSDSINNCSRVLRVAPTCAALSCVRLWLQASIFIPNACPNPATWLPSCPRPIIPKVFPFRPTPILFCHSPSLNLLFSYVIFLATSKINPHASSAVGYGRPRVPLTIIFRSEAAFMSIDAFLIPVVTINLKLGRLVSTFFVIGVLSRITHKMSKSVKRFINSFSSLM